MTSLYDPQSYQSFMTADNVRIAYKISGKGLPVLALAGLTRDGRDFDFMAQALPFDCQLIRPDSRGRGASGWADPTSYTILQETQDVIALMDHLGIEKGAIIGTSRGGLIAMVMAMMVPDRLAGVFFNDIGPELDPIGLSRIDTYLGVQPKAKTLEDMAVALSKTSGFEDVPMDRWRDQAARQFEQTYNGLKLSYDPDLRVAFEMGQSQPQPDLWPMFDACLGRPLAVVRGENSDLMSADTVGKMAERCPDLVTAIAAGRGHVPFLDEPESTAALSEWFSRFNGQY
ncbi:alpha/beta fold hydrolase [Marivivens niveibacter]|nr:alpha/beta hydrolase [Marivivens niveibacter]